MSENRYGKEIGFRFPIANTEQNIFCIFVSSVLCVSFGDQQFSNAEDIYIFVWIMTKTQCRDSVSENNVVKCTCRSSGWGGILCIHISLSLYRYINKDRAMNVAQQNKHTAVFYNSYFHLYICIVFPCVYFSPIFPLWLFGSLNFFVKE